VRIPIGNPRARFCFGRAALFWFFFCTSMLLAMDYCFAASDPNSPEDLPKLRPPKTEIPPTFLEQNGSWVVAGIVTVLVILAVLVWFLKRPRLVEPISPETKAREALAKLNQRPETGILLSGVSQIVRHYFTEAFSLPSQEFTTSELSERIQRHEQVGPELAQATIRFLRQCDERKFAPVTPFTSARSSVLEANLLLDQAEARRSELRRLAPAQSDPSTVQRG
jgi:hypothetical protein